MHTQNFLPKGLQRILMGFPNRALFAFLSRLTQFDRNQFFFAVLYQIRQIPLAIWVLKWGWIKYGWHNLPLDIEMKGEWVLSAKPGPWVRNERKSRNVSWSVLIWSVHLFPKLKEKDTGNGIIDSKGSWSYCKCFFEVPFKSLLFCVLPVFVEAVYKGLQPPQCIT